MTHQVYTVRDKVAEVCGPLFQAINHGVACRSVIQLLSKVPSYDRDAYVLWHIGTFDDSRGLLEVLEAPEVVEVNIPRFDDVEQRKFGFVPEEE